MKLTSSGVFIFSGFVRLHGFCIWEARGCITFGLSHPGKRTWGGWAGVGHYGEASAAVPAWDRCNSSTHQL